jgi:predicted alpha/beta superfamily hydrolase
MKSLDTEHLLPHPLPTCPLKAAGCQGQLKVHQWTSRSLHRRRTVVVYLPPGYESETARRYPTLYVQDGQNLFDPATSAFGVDWAMGQAIERELARGTLEPLIVVGIYNTRYRMEEYTPTVDYRERGGKARDYLSSLVEELKPWVDARYRTLPEARWTGMMGSSLSLWWAGRDLISALAGATQFHAPLRLWVDMGTRESNEDRNRNGVPDVLDDLRLLRFVLKGRGMQEGVDLNVEEIAGGAHTEADWGRRVSRVLRFLFPATGV